MHLLTGIELFNTCFGPNLTVTTLTVFTAAARVFVTMDMISKMLWATVVALGGAYIGGEVCGLVKHTHANSRTLALFSLSHTYPPSHTRTNTHTHT